MFTSVPCVNIRYVIGLKCFANPKTITHKLVVWNNINVALKLEKSKNRSTPNHADTYNYHTSVLVDEVINFFTPRENSPPNKYEDLTAKKNSLQLTHWDYNRNASLIRQNGKVIGHSQKETKEVAEASEQKNRGNEKEETFKYFIDATLGGGGHTLEILNKIKNAKVIAIDKDIESLLYVKQKLHKYIHENRLFLIHGDFRNILLLLTKHFMPLTNYYGMLVDLGVSSHQLKCSNRGFSYKYNGVLDMRMDKQSENDIRSDFIQPLDVEHTNDKSDSNKCTSENNKIHSVLNTFSAKKLRYIMETFGEEKKARKIANKIVYWRTHIGKITTTHDLKKIVLLTCKNNYKANNKVLSKVFQAFRIYINDELSALKELLRAANILLKPRGRLITIAYHSLEDTCITQMIQQKKKMWTQLNEEVITPTIEEIKRNSCSRSAKMRVFEKKDVQKN